jgi:hypothetical protein
LVLTTKAEGGSDLLESCCNLLGLTATEVLREWYVAALLHDIGYCVEVLAGLRRVLEFYEHSKPLCELTKGVNKLLSDMTHALVSSGRLPEFTAEDQPGRDHGAVGAEHLASLIENIRKQKKATPQCTAARYAIAVHNHRQKAVSFRDAPLAFLLIVCDSIQEWNRAHLAYATAPESLLARLMHGGKPEDFTGLLDKVRLEWDRGALRFTLSYRSDINRNGGVFRLWLDSTANLQRLEPDGLPFNVRIRFITPYFRNISQMDRLMDATQETHMNFLADWFPAASSGAVKYDWVRSEDGDGNCDQLELDLFQLSKKPLITDKMERFWELIPKWSHYNDDRDFAGDYAPANPR